MQVSASFQTTFYNHTENVIGRGEGNQDTDSRVFWFHFLKSTIKLKVKANQHVPYIMGSKLKRALAYRPGLLLLLSKWKPQLDCSSSIQYLAVISAIKTDQNKLLKTVCCISISLCSFWQLNLCAKITIWIVHLLCSMEWFPTHCDYNKQLFWQISKKT